MYVGGLFKHIAGQARTNLAALDLTTGMASSWNRIPDGRMFSSGVNALAVSSDRVYVAGFTRIGPDTLQQLVVLDSTQGIPIPSKR
jgi:hypothetical protein